MALNNTNHSKDNEDSLMLLDRILKAIPNKIMDSLASKYQLNKEEVNVRKKGLAQYLSVSSISKVPVTPSKAIDAAWHEFLLYTKDYEKFCHEQFGQFIHHNPGEKDANPMKSLQQYNATRQRVQIEFGELDEQVWPDLSSRFTKLEMSCCENTNCMTDCH